MELRKGISPEQQLIGVASEQFFLSTMNLFIGISQECPPWLIGIEQTESRGEDDLNGIDFKMKTKDVGEIYVQIKSSTKDARKFMEWYSKGKKKFVIVVINTRETKARLFLKTRRALSKMRQNIIRRSKEKFVLAD